MLSLIAGHLYHIYRRWPFKTLEITTTILREPAVSSTPLALIEHNSRITDTLIRYRMCEDLELDNDSRLVSYDEYTPFGASAYRLCTANAPRKYCFAGSQHDQESNLYHGGEWYHAAWPGRWTAPDPLGGSGRPSSYIYAGNDPVNFDDHRGTCRDKRINDSQPSTSQGKGSA